MTHKLHEIEPMALKDWLDQGDAIIIDVREIPEFNDEYIPQAQLHPVSTFEPRQIPSGDGKKIVFYCRSGRRSAAAALKWADYCGAPDAYSLRGGIDQWKISGLSTLSNQPGSKRIQQQVYVAAGLIILIGTILGAWVSLWFLLLPALSGLAFLYAGMAGTTFFSYLLSQCSKKPLK